MTSLYMIYWYYFEKICEFFVKVPIPFFSLGSGITVDKLPRKEYNSE